MDAKIKELWVEALCSGKYTQGRGMLRERNSKCVDSDKYCCLGVLCDVLVRNPEEAERVGINPKSVGTSKHEFGFSAVPNMNIQKTDEVCGSTMPPWVSDALGMGGIAFTRNDGVVERLPTERALMHFNDGIEESFIPQGYKSYTFVKHSRIGCEDEDKFAITKQRMPFTEIARFIEDNL